MKKLLLFLVFTSSLSYAQEYTSPQKKVNDYKISRFGMPVLPIFLTPKLGIQANVFPLSFYLANNHNNIFSFGLDLGLVPYDSLISQMSEFPTPFLRHIGAIVGMGSMKKTSYNEKLHLGFLLEFSAGMTSADFFGVNNGFYMGFAPSFILEIDQFLFKSGVYISTSGIFTIQTSLGFLLKGKK